MAGGGARKNEKGRAKGPPATTFSVLMTNTSAELQQCGQELLARKGGARRLREWRGGRELGAGEAERQRGRVKWGAQQGQQMKASMWRARQAGAAARRASLAHGGHATSVS